MPSATASTPPATDQHMSIAEIAADGPTATSTLPGSPSVHRRRRRLRDGLEIAAILLGLIGVFALLLLAGHTFANAAGGCGGG